MSQAHADAPPAMLLAARAPPGVGGRVLAGFAQAFNKPPGRCVDCHSEHEGAGPMPATPQKFCADCHDGMAARLKAAGFKATRSEEHTSELQSLMRSSYAAFRLKKKPAHNENDARASQQR